MYQITYPGENDLDYVYDLGTKHAYALGFLPPPALVRYARSSSIAQIHVNDDPVGFVVYRPHLTIDPRVTAIIQLAVQDDARRHLYATALVNHVLLDAWVAQATIVQAWCAQDLDSNDFWRALMFQLVGHRLGGSGRLGRPRPHWLWRRPLHQDADIHRIVVDPRRGPGGRYRVIVPVTAN